jgi:hypothetical protein
MMQSIGTIPAADLHGPDRAVRPSPAAEASGGPDTGKAPVYWLLGMIGALLALRWVWERSGRR